MSLPSRTEIDELLKQIEGIIGLSASFPQTRYSAPDSADQLAYANLWSETDSRLSSLRESGFPFANPNPHRSLKAMWSWIWTLGGGARERISRPRELYADLIGELQSFRDSISSGADAPGEVLREIRESARRTNELFVVIAFRDETEGFWREVVDPAATACGLRAIRIDREETETAISEEILSAIRRSLLVLCDLSFERPNCYFEAGFAKGSFRRVIFTARKDHNPRVPGSVYKVHFDVDQLKIIWWDPDQLAASRRELEDRLRTELTHAHGFADHSE